MRIMSLYGCLFFFFKQKTAYEIWRDWSSDVCSSDLRGSGLGCLVHDTDSDVQPSEPEGQHQAGRTCTADENLSVGHEDDRSWPRQRTAKAQRPACSLRERIARPATPLELVQLYCLGGAATPPVGCSLTGASVPGAGSGVLGGAASLSRASAS